MALSTLRVLFLRSRLLASLPSPLRPDLHNRKRHWNGKHSDCSSQRVCPSRPYVISDDVDKRDGDGTKEASNEIVLMFA